MNTLMSKHSKPKVLVHLFECKLKKPVKRSRLVFVYVLFIIEVILQKVEHSSLGKTFHQLTRRQSHCQH